MTSPSPTRRRRPALIVSDLDGTYLSSDGTVSDENAAAVLAARRAGIPVLFATGRPVRWLAPISDLPGAHPQVIASNGAVLYDLGARSVVDEVVIDSDVALEAIAAVRAALPEAAFGFETGLTFACEQQYVTRDPVGVPPPVRGPADELARSQRFVKILVQHRGLDSDALAGSVRSLVGGRLTVTHSTTADARGLVELSALGVSKASMLRRCCARLGISAADVAAFGDMPNDIEMLDWVGRPFAVANAHPSLLRQRFAMVESNDDAGVGRTIQRWLAQAPA